MSQRDEHQSGFERSAAFYLDAAYDAFALGQSRLAVHLFCAAFEVELRQGSVISTDIVEGLRKAWELACETGDRATAETLFHDLLPYNSEEQTEQGMLRLHGLAVEQLEGLGLTAHDLEGVAKAIANEIDSMEGDRLAESLKDALERLGAIAPESNDASAQGATQAIQKLPRFDLVGPLEGLGSGEHMLPNGQAGAVLAGAGTWLERRKKREEQERTQERNLNYQNLAGFDRTLALMKGYGFDSQESSSFRAFVEQTAALHGVYSLALMENFLFCGPSRDDNALFAHATASEIGWPVLHIQVELEADGNGSIKLSGPFKRGFFGGPPDLMELVTPCTVIIENLDQLQEMFTQEMKASFQPEVRGRQQHGRSMQAEISGYLRALMKKEGVFLIATAQKADTIKEPLTSILGALQRIGIELPDEAERRDVWMTFAAEHTSCAELDVDVLAKLSEGMTRREIVVVGITAVETAYRVSLKKRHYQKVSLGTMLSQLALHLEKDSAVYRQLEDTAVAQLLEEIEQESL
ncbi:MAG: hypothetical protein LBS98_00900 [Coriobacteriales bacterium]|nr:hypothetical protein [Coriobacteriales bacterium]